MAALVEGLKLIFISVRDSLRAGGDLVLVDGMERVK